jgi:hypothetical protein
MIGMKSFPLCLSLIVMRVSLFLREGGEGSETGLCNFFELNTMIKLRKFTETELQKYLHKKSVAKKKKVSSHDERQKREE